MCTITKLKKLKKETTTLSGFTLLELLFVVFILGVMAAVALPNWSRMIENIELRSAAQKIMLDLQGAKSNAVRHNACVGVTFTPVAYPATGGTYTVFADDGSGSGGSACNQSQDGSESVINTEVIDSRVSLVNAAIGGGSSLCFTANGVSCSSQSGNIQVRGSSKWYKITLGAAGGLRLERSSDGSTWQ